MKILTTEEQHRIKDHFEKRINRASRKDMISFLRNHFRYHTMNSWNAGTSYAHCIKISRGIGLPNDIDETKWDMLNSQKWNNHMGDLIDSFADAHNYSWQVGTNGRSGGYLVLYQGGIKNGKIICYPGRSSDQNENFDDWEMDEIKARVNIIRDFDMLASDIVIEFASFCRTYSVVDETIMVPTTIQVLKERQ